MAVDYLKTYLGIDPNDYSSMESRIRGEEPQAQAPIMMRQPMMMPQQRSLGDIEAMPMLPRQQPVQQDDSKYDGLMAEIATLKAQIDALQTPAVEEAPVMAEQAPVMAPTPAVMSEPYQAPPEIQNRMVGEPEPSTFNIGNKLFPNVDYLQGLDFSGLPALGNADVNSIIKEYQDRQDSGEPEPFESFFTEPSQASVMPQARAEDIQSSIDMLANLPKMNIPQIPDMEEIKRKMAEANMSFPEPVTYQDQLQSIRDLPAMNQMPSREQIQMAMQNIPTPVAPVSSMPRFNLPQMQSFGSPRMATGELNIDQGYRPQRMADGGSLNMALQNLKSKLNG